MTEATGTTTTTIYSGNYIYQNNVLQMINQPEGYLEPNGQGGYDYGYRLKDHLGNIRLTFVDFDHNGSIALSEITEENNYYPFGLKHKGYNNVISSNANAVGGKIKYNGKELNDELGLDLYDYGARFYGPDGSRFMTIDPMAEKYPWQSPYVYAANNPVNCIDFNGEYAIYHHYNFTYEKMTKLGYSKATADLVSHYAAVYADNPGSGLKGRALLAGQGHAYRSGIDYSGTSASQNTASQVSSSWHSMAADGENISAKNATIRGQQFGWGKIIQAGSEAKKAGGLANLKENSKGMQALGQGLHSLQDAQGHRGVNMDNHSIPDDISAPRSDIALSVTESALIVTEVLSGNTSHLSNGLTLDVSGISKSQFNVVQGAINDALKSKENVNVKFIFNNN